MTLFLRHQPKENFFPAPGDRIPVELLGVLPPSLSKTPAQVRALQQLAEAAEQFVIGEKPDRRSGRRSPSLVRSPCGR